MSSATRTVPDHPGYRIDAEPFRNYEGVKTYIATDTNGSRLLYTETKDQDVMHQVQLLDERKLDFIPKLISLNYDDGYFVHVAPPGESLHHTVTRMIKAEKMFPPQLLWGYMKELTRIQHVLEGTAMEQNGIVFPMSPDDVFIDFDRKIYLINFVKMCSQSYVMSNEGNPNACMVRKFKGREHREVSSFVELVMGDEFKITPGNSIYSMGVCMYLLANLHWPWPVRGKLCKDSHDCLALRDTVFRSNYTASDPTAAISAASINYIIDLILANTKDLIDVKPCDVINIHQIRSEMAAEETGCNVEGVVYNRGQLMYQINQIKPCQLRADDNMADLCQKFQNPSL